VSRWWSSSGPSRGTERRINGVASGVGAPSNNPVRVKLVGENPQALLEGEPTLRRSLLDWNLFHVEHQLGRLRMELRRVLSQRNLALRIRGPGPSAWDPSFVEISEEITEKRESFVHAWRSHFLALAHEFPFLAGCDLLFERGWPRDRPPRDLGGNTGGRGAKRADPIRAPSRRPEDLSRPGPNALFPRAGEDSSLPSSTRGRAGPSGRRARWVSLASGRP
jgi:hypothetical protein